MTEKLRLIKHNSELINALEMFSDFIISTSFKTPEDYLYYTKENYTIFATDGGGGTFGFIGDDISDSAPIGYVSSEGKSGKIADCLDELLSLVVFYPYYWQDVVGFYRDNKNNGLQEYINECENEILEDNPEYYNIQNTISNRLQIKKDNESVNKLIQSLSKKPYFIVYSTEDNNPSQNLL